MAGISEKHMEFSNTLTNTGMVQQIRDMARVDATQWPTSRIVNSVNNYHDKVTGYYIGSDKRFQWDDSNHTDLPEGKIDLTASHTDYSFLTDENGNRVLTLTKVELLDGGYYRLLTPVDTKDDSYDETFGQMSGKPTQYDKIADNIIRLDKIPESTISNGLRFSFQRAGSYFTASDTTKSPGVSPLLHRGYVIAGAYDCALTLGLENINALAVERDRELQFMIEHFGSRGLDNEMYITPREVSFR